MFWQNIVKPWNNFMDIGTILKQLFLKSGNSLSSTQHKQQQQLLKQWQRQEQEQQQQQRRRQRR